MKKELLEAETKECPICHRHIDIFIMYCKCGYEFGGNRCTNPDCRKPCGDFTSFCSDCGCETQNYLDGYLDGYIGGLPSNVF